MDAKDILWALGQAPVIARLTLSELDELRENAASDYERSYGTQVIRLLTEHHELSERVAMFDRLAHHDPEPAKAFYCAKCGFQTKPVFGTEVCTCRPGARG